jgi:phosphatidylserine/phosphatidylglycerophosphate/cardiolipin synthase-like enzyme
MIKKIILCLYFVFSFFVVVNAKNKESLGEVKAIYFAPSLDCENLVVEQINQAESEVNIIIYSVTNVNITKAIISAKDGGKTVKVIVDRTQSKGKNSLIDELIASGIDVRISKKHKIEHNKVTIVDRSKVITGSYNYTNNATKYNSENCILIEDKGLKYQNRFNVLWRYYE